VPKLRQQTFETAIIGRYRRRESSVEEALIEMYLAGVSVRRVEDITEALWGTRVSPATVSDLNKKIYGIGGRFIPRLANCKCTPILAPSLSAN
jgi:transposase-like protein